MVGDTTDSNRVVYAVVTATLLATFGWKRRWLTVPAAVTAWPVGLVVFMAGTEFALMLLVRIRMHSVPYRVRRSIPTYTIAAGVCWGKKALNPARFLLQRVPIWVSDGTGRPRSRNQTNNHCI